jgi:hypothetical protein
MFYFSHWQPSIRAKKWRITILDMWDSFPCFNAHLLKCVHSAETGIPPIIGHLPTVQLNDDEPGSGDSIFFDSI